MTSFEPGLALARSFYAEAVAPLVRAPHAACLLGEGSEVLGYDDERSTDHEWGPRVQLLVPPERTGEVRRAVEAGLPREYGGRPTAWYSLATGTVSHHVEITTFDAWIAEQLGFDPRAGLDHADWLALPQQRLLHVTRGEVFRDDPGDLTRVRAMLEWYPDDVWRWLLAAQWHLIGNTEPLLGRTLETGDRRGARLLAAKLCRLAMETAFLQERRYRPYDKWFGTAFAELEAAATLGPLLDAEDFTSALLELAHRQNALGLAAPVVPAAGDFRVGINDAVRPYRVVNAGEIAASAVAAISDPALRSLVAVGGIDQLTHADDAMVTFTPWPRELAAVYRSLLASA
ncbi:MULTISPECIES: DUF4037 domain-containing protein [Actinomadura]|uniref:DUF4037 domain-containing protein n=1 Tax=Actinomadura yumaensis TaxID=111807 RepID=A0ABW2CJH3_9ACTN|nr:DUF4037 domain-containing protein [Actinomadura sp. J1-007]MWK37829.1 DUF4037 domain-containing protein [Actinomadura sp. J1-007]